MAYNDINNNDPNQNIDEINEIINYKRDVNKLSTSSQDLVNTANKYITGTNSNLLGKYINLVNEGNKKYYITNGAVAREVTDTAPKGTFYENIDQPLENLGIKIGDPLQINYPTGYAKSAINVSWPTYNKSEYVGCSDNIGGKLNKSIFEDQNDIIKSEKFGDNVDLAECEKIAQRNNKNYFSLNTKGIGKAVGECWTSMNKPNFTNVEKCNLEDKNTGLMIGRKVQCSMVEEDVNECPQVEWEYQDYHYGCDPTSEYIAQKSNVISINLENAFIEKDTDTIWESGKQFGGSSELATYRDTTDFECYDKCKNNSKCTGATYNPRKQDGRSSCLLRSGEGNLVNGLNNDKGYKKDTDYFFKVDLYEGDNFESLRATTYESEVNFGQSFDKSHGGDGNYYSIKITGKVPAYKDGNNEYYVRSDDGVKAWVNGQVVVGDEAWKPQGATNYSFTVNDMMKDQKFNIEIWHYQRSGGATIEFRQADGTIVKIPSPPTIKPPDAESCPGWDCTINGQYCPHGTSAAVSVPSTMSLFGGTGFGNLFGSTSFVGVSTPSGPNSNSGYCCRNKRWVAGSCDPLPSREKSNIPIELDGRYYVTGIEIEGAVPSEYDVRYVEGNNPFNKEDINTFPIALISSDMKSLTTPIITKAIVIVAKNHDASFRVKQLHGMKVTNSNIGDSISYMKTVKLNDAIRELNLEMITPEGNGVSIPACIENSIILKKKYLVGIKRHSNNKISYYLPKDISPSITKNNYETKSVNNKLATGSTDVTFKEENGFNVGVDDSISLYKLKADSNWYDVNNLSNNNNNCNRLKASNKFIENRKNIKNMNTPPKWSLIDYNDEEISGDKTLKPKYNSIRDNYKWCGKKQECEESASTIYKTIINDNSKVGKTGWVDDNGVLHEIPTNIKNSNKIPGIPNDKLIYASKIGSKTWNMFDKGDNVKEDNKFGISAVVEPKIKNIKENRKDVLQSKNKLDDVITTLKTQLGIIDSSTRIENFTKMFDINDSKLDGMAEDIESKLFKNNIEIYFYSFLAATMLAGTIYTIRKTNN